MLKDPEEIAKFGGKAVVGRGEERLELRIRSSMKADRFLGQRNHGKFRYM